MREIVSIATVFLLLALSGTEAAPYRVAKTCHSGVLAWIDNDCR